jgi:hypothetical protein
MLTTEITENTEEKVSVGSVPSVVLSTNKSKTLSGAGGRDEEAAASAVDVVTGSF